MLLGLGVSNEKSVLSVVRMVVGERKKKTKKKERREVRVCLRLEGRRTKQREL